MWLTTTDPLKLVQCAPPHTDRWLHGTRDRKVVLSKELLEANEHTPATVVSASQMIDSFLQEVEAASKQAVENDVPLLVLLFCHAIGNWDFLLDGSDKQEPPDLGVDVAEMMAFRWYASFPADYMVAMFGLKAPNGQTCLMWDRLAWFFSNARKSIPQYGEIYNEVWSALRNGDVDLLPSDIQGPPFIQFKEYLTTAIAASDLGRDGAVEVAARMVQFMNTIRDFTKERNLTAAMRSESVINTGREMFKALRRKFRLP